MVDLVRHDFMGPSPRYHFRSAAEFTTTVLRSVHMYAAQNTHSEDMVRSGQISTKVCPQSGVLFVHLQEFRLRSAGTRKEVLAR